LGFEDVAALLHVLQRLTDGGNTVIVIEHNMDVVKNADYIIDLGPGAGDKGGYVIATGTPEEVARQTDSATGQYLKETLAKNGRKAAIGGKR
jgi:excinuclease ABC subunit A